MALITLPAAFSFTRIERLQLVRVGNVFRSRYTGARQLVTYPFAVWEFEGTLVDYDGPQAAAIRSFFVKLKGQENSFRLPVPGYSNPATGMVDANIAVSVAALARVSSLSLKQMNVSAPILKEGDYFTINDELKVVTVDLTSDAGGNGTVYFEPPLRKPAAIDAILTINNPYVLLNASDDDVATWGLSAPFRHGLKIEAVEAFVQ